MWLDYLFPPPKRRPPAPRRLSVEPLEDRLVPAALLSVHDAAVVEGNEGTRTAEVTVTLNEPQRKAVSVTYRTADLTAAAGVDYRAASGTLTFARGETSKTIRISVIGDRLAGPEGTSDFAVRLSGASGARIGQAQAVVMIYDDEPWAFISSVSQPEGNSGAAPLTFAATLSHPYDRPVTVRYATADGSARAGTDYARTAGTLVFAPGETYKPIPVQVAGDRTPAPDGYKTFFVKLTTPDKHTGIGYDGVGHGVIVDDEPRVGIGSAYNFGVSNFTFDVSLQAAYDQPVTVRFSTADGTALAGRDYAATSGTITFAPGEVTKTITVVALDPTLAPDKHFFVHLSDPTANAAVSGGAAFGFFDGYYDPGYWYYDPYSYGYY